jgi:hypothetical protein
MRRLYALIAMFAVAALGACEKSDNAPGPGGVTVGEARALDEAAEMIEQRRLPEEALRPPAPPPAATASPVPAQ